MTNKTKKIQITDLTQGDTVLVDGVMITVGSNDVSSAFATTFRGERYENNEVDQVLFRKWHKGEVIGWTTFA